jgi:hypothetical protein
LARNFGIHCLHVEMDAKDFYAIFESLEGNESRGARGEGEEMGGEWLHLPLIWMFQKLDINTLLLLLISKVSFWFLSFQPFFFFFGSCHHFAYIIEEVTNGMLTRLTECLYVINL